MDGGGDRELGTSAGWHVGNASRTPVPCYLVHVMRGNGHKENWGTERSRPPLRVKASHRLNPADPGLKVALEPWALSLESWHLPLQPRAALTWAEDSHPRALVDHRLLPDSSA